ncbi:hypothetical protein P3X46_003026 [Hevea brasiliensis]|uniref:Uncharacterized protein n=2 Tax=Hevea brasiliensis TaxID=3981 RepID=A0ABQ9N750_HEVBR|nr:uncharacterized protein LOC110645192 isoform X1 [Hevea brasiliensis]KAF2325386.1 hypothetical protein GH714_027333 [Hevea brasiliensis]KAJ9187588.1 hypothetical protein P3X46_003026 [Hevea brasiliensis]
MAEASKGRVTITLGRTGQVVKRAAAVSEVDYDDPLRGAGNKRSVRDRLGSSFESFPSYGSLANNKRQRGDSYLTSLSANGVEDVRIGKDDLRFKLMQKNVSRRPQSDYYGKTMDLREKLSRTVQPSGPPLNTVDAMQRMPDPKNTSILGRIPPARSADNLPQIDSSRNSCSPWTLDHIRRRSPDRIIGSSRGLSPPRNVEELQRRPLSRTFDDGRTVSYMNKDVLDASRPVSSSTPFMTKSVLPAVSTKPAAPLLGQLPPPTASGILQKSSYVGEEQQTVEGLLHSLGLGKYAILFKAEEVDMTALKQMGESDLKELGIPMGPRKKILLALLPLSKRQPR